MALEHSVFKMLFAQSTLCPVQYSELTGLMHFEDVRGDVLLQLAFGFQDECGPAMFVFKITLCNILSILTTLMHCILSWRCFYSWLLVFKMSVAIMQASADEQTWEVYLGTACNV